ncbi:AI-2E family transporter [Halorarum salinum]|uniref:AI-2E family transporter n=1 Tax=Halorarum salinum TaxID=2743089 RepID=A0A7D5QB07_9EURY|nr:AI-2E family transporter [Halobaculum salinum]QLG61440.1 AI-2E family transporter [Halobaculum salinum]
MKAATGLLLVLVGILLLFSVALVLPFLQYFLLAVLLAYVLAPLQRRLVGRMAPRTAAGVLVTAATVAVIVPLVVVVRVTASEAISLLEGLREGELTLAGVEQFLLELTGQEVDLTEMLRTAVGEVGTEGVGSLLGAFGVLAHTVLGLGLTVFLLFYFLKDGERLLGWLRATTPLPDRVQADLYARLDGIMGAVLVGHVLVALVQGVLAGLGLFATGVPNATFWTAVMVVLSLLPIVGSFMVWGPAVVYLFAIGQPVPALLLLVYGTIVVGISDDYLRPIVVDRYAKVNPSVIIIGVLGGVYVLGFMGIFFGPVIIGALRATLDVYREEYGPRTRA